MARHFRWTRFGPRVTSDVRAVFVQATESSTGARHDVEGIAKIVRAHGDDTLLVVDAITGLGTTHLDVDGWGVDCDHRRIAESADDASGAGVLRGQRAGMEAHGDDDLASLLL